MLLISTIFQIVEDACIDVNADEMLGEYHDVKQQKWKTQATFNALNSGQSVDLKIGDFSVLTNAVRSLSLSALLSMPMCFETYLSSPQFLL